MNLKHLLFILLVGLTLVGCQRYSGGEPVEDKGKLEAEAKKENVKQENEVKNNEDNDESDTFIKDSVDPLIRSVSANIDTNWQFYLLEPVERLANDGNLDSFNSDVGLLVDLYKGIIKQVDELEVPNYLNDDQAQEVDKIKSSLTNSINKRIEVAENLISENDKDAILNAKIDGLIEESNNHLKDAVAAYESLIK